MKILSSSEHRYITIYKGDCGKMAHTCLTEKASLSRERHSCHFPFSAPNPRYASHTRYTSCASPLGFVAGRGIVALSFCLLNAKSCLSACGDEIIQLPCHEAQSHPFLIQDLKFSGEFPCQYSYTSKNRILLFFFGEDKRTVSVSSHCDLLTQVFS